MGKKSTVLVVLLLFLASGVLFAARNKDSGPGKGKREKRKKDGKTEEVQAPSRAPGDTPAFVFGHPEEEVKRAEEKAAEEAREKAERRGGTIRGRVLNESGIPLAGAGVLCADERGNVVAETVTDSQGYYEFTGLGRGEYTVSVRYSGVAGPVVIRFPDGGKGLPSAPGRLVVAELEQGVPGANFVRAEWARVQGANAYRCELYIRGQERPLVQRPDTIQNFCDFEGLSEDTEYEVRVYARGDSGYSEGYASASIRTVHKPPLPPTGLGVAYAKNNRVDLLWNAAKNGGLKGYLVQVKKGDGPYLYLGNGALTPNRDKALVVEGGGRQYVELTIAGFPDGAAPLLENLVPYSFRVTAVDARGYYSKPSLPVTNILLEDTVPPRAPVNVRYVFIGSERLRISWDRPDRDAVKYKVSYGVNKDRLDGVVYTETTSCDLVVKMSRLRDKELIVNVTAIDRAGNESGYGSVEKRAFLLSGEGATGDIVVAGEDGYRDYSLVVRPPSGAALAGAGKAKAPSKPGAAPAAAAPTGREMGFGELKRRGFVVQRGETARISEDVAMPDSAIIKVSAGGRLVVENSRIGAERGTWGGIRYLAGSSGYVKNSAISDAGVGVAVLNVDGAVSLSNVVVSACAEYGVYIQNSKVDLSFVHLRGNGIGLFAENSRVSIADSIFEKNEKGILSADYSLSVRNSKFVGNAEYGLRVYGGGRIERSSFKDNLVGIVLEKGRGSVQVTGCSIELNRMDGIVSGAANADLSGNLIASNGRHGVYLRDGANPYITDNDIVNNKVYAVVGGGRVLRSFVAYNNGSPYSDDTGERGKPDNVFSSSSSSLPKQIVNADYISTLSFSSVLR